VYKLSLDCILWQAERCIRDCKCSSDCCRHVDSGGEGSRASARIPAQLGGPLWGATEVGICRPTNCLVSTLLSTRTMSDGMGSMTCSILPCKTRIRCSGCYSLKQWLPMHQPCCTWEQSQCCMMSALSPSVQHHQFSHSHSSAPGLTAHPQLIC